MSSRQPLAVWLYGIHIATLSERQYNKFRLDFNPEARADVLQGSTILSISMPFTPGRRPNATIVRGWFDAVLPEGNARTVVANLFGVQPGDDYALIENIGKDCAGAVIIQPMEESATQEEGMVVPLRAGELEQMVAELPQRPFGAGPQMRVSLAGMQEKLLLAETPDGQLGKPINGAPSTLILKPEDMRLPGYAKGEAFALGMAKHLGLTNVTAEIVTVEERDVLKVSRYDRVKTSTGVKRIHQEDATQALGLNLAGAPERKYQAHGGPSFREFATMLRIAGQSSALDKLLALTVLNVVIGNADAHARNLSILHHRDGSVDLAPAYDLTPTTFYRNIPTRDGPRNMSDELGMFINGKRSIHDVRRSDLQKEGESWGLTHSGAENVIERTISEIGRYLNHPPLNNIPPKMLEFFIARLRTLDDKEGPGGNGIKGPEMHIIMPQSKLINRDLPGLW